MLFVYNSITASIAVCHYDAMISIIIIIRQGPKGLGEPPRPVMTNILTLHTGLIGVLSANAIRTIKVILWPDY